MKSVVFIRSNPVFSDSRVEKEVSSLINNAFKVVILAWDREGFHKSSDSLNGARLLRFKLPVQYHRLIVVAYYPIFWLWVLIKLLAIKPRFVHSCDLDTLLPALFYRLLSRDGKVIFDVFDNYGLLIQSRSVFLGRIVKAIEFILSSFPDALIIVCEERMHLFHNKKPILREIIINAPPDHSISKCRQSLNCDESFRIIYAGTISLGVGLIELAEATSNLENVEVILAGRVNDEEAIVHLRRYRQVTYIGQLSFDEALNLQAKADLIPILYNPIVPINTVAAPNKLYEAMMLGIPVITTVCQDMIRRVGCGLLVDYNSHDIREAILVLKNDKHLRKDMGGNGRLAFQKFYNWSHMEKKLNNLYCDLTNKKNFEK